MSDNENRNGDTPSGDRSTCEQMDASGDKADDQGPAVVGFEDAVEPPDDEVDLSDPRFYLNRELSELSFQQRVLHEAIDDRNPLLERVKFSAMFTSNVDEFLMKRVGGLKQQMAADVTDTTPDGRTPAEQWRAIHDELPAMLRRQSACFHDRLVPALDEAGIRILDWYDLSSDERSGLREYFEWAVLPTLTPLAFDPTHSFPHISNLSLSLAVLTRAGDDEAPTFSRVKIPGNRPRFVQVGDKHRYVLLETIVVANLDLLFPDVEVVDFSTFRVIRNAEVRRNEEVADDLIDVIESVLRERRFATVVRLEITEGTPDRVREVLVEQLDLDAREVVELPAPLGLDDLMELAEIDRPDLKREPWTPQPHPRLSSIADENASIFDLVRRNDVLVHHPYHSFEHTVHRFIDEAAHDPDVLAIKAAIYRTAGDSKVIESLIEAVRNGKQVAVMVELKAKFDEAANLRWVQKLEKEGIHVAYGAIGLKTHAKTTLVVREERDAAKDATEVRLYAHLGTGNYHSETAKIYEDLGLLTADPDIGQDLVKLFNFFTGHSLHTQCRDLLIAPENLRAALVARIRREADHARAGREARIVAKMNRLEDAELVEELYRASCAGVSIELVVRDICRLRPGLPGLSDNVTVSSIVGRFLEHSRIFYFHDDGDPEYYIGSADWMKRNLDKRVEAVGPIEDAALRADLDEILALNLGDNRKRWVMDAAGRYQLQYPRDGKAERSVQDALMERALRGDHGAR